MKFFQRIGTYGIVLSGLMALLFVSAPSAVMAGGGQAYPNGAEAFMPGAAPPPGLTMINYFFWGHAEDLKDDHGDTVKHPNGKDALNRVDVIGDLVRLIWISNFQLLGGNYGQHFFAGLLYTGSNFNGPVSPDMSESFYDFNSPYFIYSPFVLTWHLMQGQLHVVTSLCDIYFPFDNEDENNPTSVGRNFWTFEPVLAVTWMPTKAWEVSTKFMYDINTRQDDYVTAYPVTVDRTPGQEFHMDFNVSYMIIDNLRVGINGYYYQQVTDDDIGGIPDAWAGLEPAFEEMEGEHSRALALGPGAFYQYRNMMFTLRYQHEFAVRNKAEMQNLWFKFIYVF